MSTLLVFAENLRGLRAIAPVLRRNLPDAILLATCIPASASPPFQYPEPGAWNALPVLSAPRYGDPDRPSTTPRVTVNRIATDGALVESRWPPSLAVKEASEILYAGAARRAAVFAFHLRVTLWGTASRKKKFSAAWMPDAMDDAGVQMAYAARESLAASLRWRALVDQGALEHYFDYNYQVNALGIIGETLRRNRAQAPRLSRNALQLLYWVRANARPDLGVTEASLRHQIKHWTGTGRYPHTPMRLGSSSSGDGMVSDLLSDYLLQRERDGIRLSDKGHAVLSCLHADCEDPDQPFRLGQWLIEGEPARPKMDRYLTTFFGRQKRFAEKNARTPF